MAQWFNNHEHWMPLQGYFSSQHWGGGAYMAAVTAVLGHLSLWASMGTRDAQGAQAYMKANPNFFLSFRICSFFLKFYFRFSKQGSSTYIIIFIGWWIKYGMVKNNDQRLYTILSEQQRWDLHPGNSSTPNASTMLLYCPELWSDIWWHAMDASSVSVLVTR